MTSLIRAFRLGLLNMDFIRQVLSKDVKSGFVVGIIALPMSLGIALASGFPPFAGLVTSLVGGLLVSFLSGSRLCIKGPAGGLSALTLGSVLLLGKGDLILGYQITLAVIVVSGGFQILFALGKMGNLGDFFPAAAIHGMLAGLGFIMAVKQLPPMLGMGDSQMTLNQLLEQAPALLSNINPKIALIGLVCLLLLSLHPLFPKSISNSVPSVILMLVIAIPLGLFLHLGEEHVYHWGAKSFDILPDKALVYFPQDLLSTLSFPDFHFVSHPDFWVFSLILALAGNIESLLTCKAVDQIDPWHRSSNYNQDLLAIGVGNVISGMCGGLPMISESKRSVVNIDLGGTTFASNFFHAFFLLLFILLAQPFMQLIPVSALAAFLVFTGIKMALPKEFSKSYRIGKEQFAVFVLVFLLTVTTNLLYGVLAGTLLELIINMQFGATSRSLFESNMQIETTSAYQFEAKVNGPATFSNFLWVKKELQAIPENATIIIDFSKATVVDHSFMENLSHFETLRKQKGGNMALSGLDYHVQVSGHPLAARRMIRSEETPRQQELQQFSVANGLDLDKRRLVQPNKFDIFPLDQKWKVSYIENTVRKAKSNEQVFELADIHCVTDSVLKQSFTATVLTVANLPLDHIPDFQLLTEGHQRTLLSVEGKSDINFSAHPAFSYYYFLSGENEIAIREALSEKFISYLEQNKGYSLCFERGSLLVYRRTDLLAPEEMEKLWLFAEGLISLLFEDK